MDYYGFIANGFYDEYDYDDNNERTFETPPLDVVDKYCEMDKLTSAQFISIPMQELNKYAKGALTESELERCKGHPFIPIKVDINDEDWTIDVTVVAAL